VTFFGDDFAACGVDEIAKVLFAHSVNRKAATAPKAEIDAVVMRVDLTPVMIRRNCCVHGNLFRENVKRADADDVSVPATPARRSRSAPKESNAPHSFANKNSQSFALRSAFGTRNVADMGECYLIELHGMSLRIVSGFNGHNNGADTLRAGFTLKVCDRQRETGDNGFRKLPTSPRPRFGLGRRVVYYPARWLDWSRPFFRVGDGPGPLGKLDVYVWQLTAAGARTPYVLS
jgi:hypothetical protein